MRSVLAMSFPTLYHSLTILREGLNMFWMSRTKSTRVPGEIEPRSTSQKLNHRTAAIVRPSRTAMTKLNWAWIVAILSEARMLWSLCREKFARSTWPRP
jgi:hypothetical protein